MKKYFLSFLIVCVLFMTTACGNDTNNDDKDKTVEDSGDKISAMTCSKSENEDGEITESNAIIKYNSKDKKVISVEETTKSKIDAQYIDLSISISNTLVEAFNKIEGLSMKVSKEGEDTMVVVTSVDYTKFDYETMISILGDLFDEDNSSPLLSKEDVTIDKIKNDILNDYTCN